MRVSSYSLIENSILFDNVQIGRNCTLKNAILDKNVVVPSDTNIGVNLDDDRARGFTVTETGIVVVPKGYQFS